MKKTTAKEVLIFVLSFAVPTLIFALCWANIGITYNGELTPLIYDMNAQYMPFMTSLRYVLNGDNSIFFNWSVSLGGDYLSLFAYYLASPLNLLTVLWDVEQMPQAIYVITLIKIGLCGLTFQTFLRFGLAKRKSSYVNIVFASCYSLMSYNIVYSMCLMWLDGVILLPLVLLGVEKLFEGKKGAVYFFSIFGCFYCNFYISYMVGIFTAVYFLTCVLRYWEKGCVKQMLVKAGRFTLLTLTALGLTLPMVLPALLSFAKGKGIATAGEEINPAAYQFSFLELLKKMLPQQFDSIEYDGLPSIYCGSLIVLLAFIYLFARIRWREKISYFLLLALPFLGFVIPKLDIAWHGFQIPHCFPYRYAFLFSTGLIICAFNCYRYIDLCFGLMIYYRKIVFLATSYLMFELFLNGSFAIGTLHETTGYYLKQNFEGEYLSLKPVAENTKAKDSEFFRIGEQLTKVGSNFSFLYNYPGTEYFGSMMNYPINQFLNRLGKTDTYYLQTIEGVEPFSQCFLGIKYLLTPWQVENCVYQDITDERLSDKILEYYNKYACSLGTLIDREGISEGELFTETSYENANNLAKLLTGEQEEIYSCIDLRVEDALIPMEGGKRYIAVSFYGERNAKLYLDVIGRWTRNSGKRLQAQEDAKDQMGDDETEKEAALLIKLDDEIIYRGKYTLNFQRGIDLGRIPEAGEHTLVFQYPEEMNLSSIQLYFQNEDVLKQNLEILQSRQMKEAKLHKNGAVGKVHAADHSALITSLPYDEGWNVYVDGVRTNYQKMLDAFLMVDIPPGEHTVEFRYIPKGFREGCVLAAISLIVIVIYYGVKRKQNVNIS
ncbi:MAG: YfhO family protein [Acetatifactor sp.]